MRLNYLHEAKLMGSAGAVKQMEAFFDRHLRRGRLRRSDRRQPRCAGRVPPQAQGAGDDRTRRDGRRRAVRRRDHRRRRAHHRISGEAGARERNARKLVNTGIYVFEPEILQHIPAGAFYDFGKELFPELQSEGRRLLRSASCAGRTGATSARRRSTAVEPNDVLAGRVRLRGRPGPGHPARRDSGRRRADRGRRAHRRGRAPRGPLADRRPDRDRRRSVVGASAVIEGSILWDDVRVGDGAHVDDAIVGLGYAVPAHATLAHSIVAKPCGNGHGAAVANGKAGAAANGASHKP